MKEFKPELLFIQNVIRQAFDRYGNQYREVSQKDRFDLVTDLDVAIEQYITNQIHEQYPQDSILGEELTQNSVVQGRTWTIDPIDGTVNMANRIPIYGIQCALLENAIPLVSAIFFPETGTMCYAQKGAGAYIGERKQSCASATAISHSIVTMGDFLHDEAGAKRQLQVLQNVSSEVAKIRMFGAASYDFFLLATGATHAHIMFATTLWDIIPGLLIAQEAGAVVTNLKGDPYTFEDDSLLVAADESLSRQLLKLIAN